MKSLTTVGRTLRAPIFALAAVGLLLTGAAFARQHEIIVDGTAHENVSPDLAVLTLAITTLEGTLEESKKLNESRSSDLTRALRREGIAEEDIQTGTVQANRSYEWTDQRRIFRGFQVSRGVHVKLRDINLFERVVSAVLENEEVELAGTEFMDSKRAEREIQLRRQAVENARLKAVAMADQLGQRIGKATRIVDSAMPQQFMVNRPVARALSMEAAIGDGPMPAPGDVELEATVAVTFELLP